MDGTIMYNYTENLTTHNYWDRFSGNLETQVDDVLGTQIVTLTGLNYQERGSLLDNSYIIDTYTYAMEINGPDIVPGILVSIDSPKVESSGDSCPESGTLRIRGANDSFALGQYDGVGVEISANGNSVGFARCL